MTRISTHVLDTQSGRPATRVAVRLVRDENELAAGQTDADGRWVALDDEAAEPGDYRLEFEVGEYYAGYSFHPRVCVDFTVSEAGAGYHVPLLVSPFAYTTYRGS
jgi:5-hydroxyisourate hydrolase